VAKASASAALISGINGGGVASRRRINGAMSAMWQQLGSAWRRHTMKSAKMRQNGWRIVITENTS
jgi:hypothetical protein